ncbi:MULTISPECIES: SHOCT domain-containing protein [Haloarcula]|uniref:SHOCT domain-containing protein n=1 Tax=Haloarcula TaxID=2237 RepID=UPI0023E84D22|nr:SHOCT domain-containing protein [Halomicroarcula sp. SHR3]
MNDRSTAALGRIARLALVALVVVLAATGPAAAHAGDDGTHHHDGWMGTHGGMGWGMGWGAWFLWPALLLLGGVAAYALLRQANGGTAGSDDAMSALRERYARGDIDEEEFEQRRQTLQRGES